MRAPHCTHWQMNDGVGGIGTLSTRGQGSTSPNAKPGTCRRYTRVALEVTILLETQIFQPSAPPPATTIANFARCCWRLWSLADIEVSPRDVRFTPESGHSSERFECPLRAKSAHWLTHSRTTSAVASSAGEIVRLSTLAVFRFTTSSYLVGACTLQ